MTPFFSWEKRIIGIWIAYSKATVITLSPRWLRVWRFYFRLGE
jgi:hypothetical protein